MKKKEFMRKQREEMKELKKIMNQLCQTVVMVKNCDSKLPCLNQIEDGTGLSTEAMLDQLQEEAAAMEFSDKKEETIWLKQYHSLEKKIMALSLENKMLKKSNSKLFSRSQKIKKELEDVNGKIDKLSKMYSYILYLSGVYNYIPEMHLNTQYKKVEKKAHKKQERQYTKNYGKYIDVPYTEVACDDKRK